MSISGQTRKRLWGRAHNECAFPGCLTELAAAAGSGGTGASVVGEEAHIRAQSAGGPRFDPNYEGVDGYDNLVLLCPTHHTMIDADGGVAYSVDSLLQMKLDHENSQLRRGELRATLDSYVGDRYVAEGTVVFQQAELRGQSVDSMFVDVPIGYRQNTSALSDLFSRVTEDAAAGTEDLEEATGMSVAGATQILLHPDWRGNAVLIGGPGQGKSTLLQYICQYYRARRLGKPTYAASDATLARAQGASRFPIRIEIRKYAQWAPGNASWRPSKRGTRQIGSEDAGGTWGSLEEYIVDEIRRHIGGRKFRRRDLALLIETEPVLLALDGLDEVANALTRTQVVSEIAATYGRLSVHAADLVLFVTTRPGASLQTLNTTAAFPTLHLQRLTPGLRLQYLKQWSSVTGLTEEAAARLQSIFTDSQTLPHINELASYPMQLAILLHLLHRRQLLPQQRTELYAEYLKTFLDREQTEDKEPLLADQRRVVEDTHAYLGWYLQTRAENGPSAGSITRPQLRALLHDYLAGQPEEQALAEQLYSAITDRVLCLVERDDVFEFEVQSLREYFAALYIFENLPAKGTQNSRDDGLNELLERPYWSNVCRFFLGMLSRGEVRALIGNFRTVRERSAPQPIAQSMAATVLADRIYDGHTRPELREVVDFIFEGPGVVFAEDGIFDPTGAPLRLSERAGRQQAVEHLMARLEASPADDLRESIVSSLRAHAAETDDLQAWWWGRFAPTAAWLEIAAGLQLLGGLSHGDEDRLLAAMSIDSPDAWATDLVRTGGYDGTDERIRDFVKGDLNAGAAVVLARRPVSTSPIGGLVNSAINAAQGTQQGFSRSRGLATGSVRPPKARVVEDSPSEQSWAERVETCWATWGDGWILQRTIAGVPEVIDLGAMARRVSTSPLSALLAHQADCRSRASDVAWWRSEIANCTSEGESALAVTSLLELGRGSVILALEPELQAAIDGLGPKRYRAVEQLLSHNSEASRHRMLDLQEAFRLNRLALDGRAMWLVWLAASDATRDRIASRLRPRVGDVLSAGAARSAAVLVAVGGKKKLPIETFEHARGLLRFGPWVDLIPGDKLTRPGAKAIIESPWKWPTALVQIALDRLSDPGQKHRTTLDEVAARDRWFS